MQGMICRAGLVAVLALPTTTWAWDEEIGAAAPTLSGFLPSHTSVDRIDVELRGRNVSLTYHGEQSDKHPQSIVLSAYPALFGWQGVAADYPNLHFPELSVKVNRQPIKPTTHASAHFEGEDVTRELNRIGISPLRVALPEDALIDPKSIGAKRARRLFSSGGADTNRAYPLWQLSYSQTWKLPQLITGPVSIQNNYNARPAKSEINTDSKTFSAAVLSHCGNLEQIKEILKDKNDEVPAAVVMETSAVPLLLANMAPTNTFLTTAAVGKSRPGLQLAVTLACGPEEASLLGRPTINSSKTATTSVLSVLEIFVQSSGE